MFTKLFLPNIINHGESYVQWQISTQGGHLSVFRIGLWKEKVALNGEWEIIGISLDSVN